MSCWVMLSDIKMWTSYFEATSCQDEFARDHLRAGTAGELCLCRWEALARRIQLRGGFTAPPSACSVNSDSTIQEQGYPKHCRTHPFLCMLGKETAEWRVVWEILDLHRSTVHLTCWICRGHQLIVKIIGLCLALQRCWVVCRRVKQGRGKTNPKCLQ